MEELGERTVERIVCQGKVQEIKYLRKDIEEFAKTLKNCEYLANITDEIINETYKVSSWNYSMVFALMVKQNT